MVGDTKIGLEARLVPTKGSGWQLSPQWTETRLLADLGNAQAAIDRIEAAGYTRIEIRDQSQFGWPFDPEIAEVVTPSVIPDRTDTSLWQKPIRDAEEEGAVITVDWFIVRPQDGDFVSPDIWFGQG